MFRPSGRPTTGPGRRSCCSTAAAGCAAICRSTPRRRPRRAFGPIWWTPTRRGAGRAQYGMVMVCTGAVFRGWERAGDIAASVRGISARPEVDASKIALAGWSHGGWGIMELMASPLTAPGEIGLDDPQNADLKGVRAVFLAYPYVGPIAVRRTAPWVRTPAAFALIARRDHLTTVRNAERVYAAIGGERRRGRTLDRRGDPRLRRAQVPAAHAPRPRAGARGDRAVQGLSGGGVRGRVNPSPPPPRGGRAPASGGAGGGQWPEDGGRKPVRRIRVQRDQPLATPYPPHWPTPGFAGSGTPPAAASLRVLRGDRQILGDRIRPGRGPSLTPSPARGKGSLWRPAERRRRLDQGFHGHLAGVLRTAG